MKHFFVLGDSKLFSPHSFFVFNVVGRPFRVPLGTVGCILMCIPGMLMMVFVMSLATYKTFIFCAIVNILSYYLYHLSRRIQTQRKCFFEPEENIAASALL